MAPPLIKPRQLWWEKLANKVKSFSPHVKQGLITGSVALVVGFAGLLVPYLIYSRENTSLKHDLSSEERTLAALRHENQILAAENNRWKLLMDPVERKAKEIYPELESSAAIAKLAKDLEDTRNLATRAEFKPLTPQLKAQVVSRLKGVQEAFRAEKITFVVSYQHGSLGRSKLAQELTSLMEESGVPVRLEGSAQYRVESFDTPVRVLINLSGGGEKLYRATEQAISRFLTSGLVALGNPTSATNEIVVQIMGTPAFLPDGSVIFE